MKGGPINRMSSESIVLKSKEIW